MIEVGDKIIVLSYDYREVIDIPWCLKVTAINKEIIEYKWCCPDCDFVAHRWSALVHGFRNGIPYEEPDWDYCPNCGNAIRW